ncbi:MAG: flotillin family protein [Cyanobacteria bacterium J083]|nr:MAG: flotillin family protein [Cyanobacteria bacterium J083]
MKQVKTLKSPISSYVNIELGQIQPQPLTAQNNALTTLVNLGVPTALLILTLMIIIWVIKSCLCICKPNEIVILAGRKRKTKEGREVGYRVISGGRAIRIPILETIKRMDITTMPVQVEVTNAYSQGGIPLDIQAIANVKLSSDPSVVGNAIERFLERDRQEIIRVAKETLEGNLRGVVATLTPEELNEDRLRFAETIASDVSRDLIKLGIALDTLKIQSIADDVDYLRSIGRSAIANIIRDAEVAESDAMTEAETTEAQWEEQAKVKQTQDSIIILEKENQLREIKAELEQEAKSQENITIATIQAKKAKAEQELQTIRAQLERLRLQAEEILPAIAYKQAQELQAQGKAAIIAEKAKAAALVNEMLSQVWLETGTEAKELFLIQQLENILQEAVEIPSRLDLGTIRVVDNGDGKSVASLVRVYPEIVQEFLVSVKEILGIDIKEILQSRK